MTDPLIYTTLGNIPAADVERKPEWEVTPDYIKLTVKHVHRQTGEVVKCDVDVCSLVGFSAGALAAQL